MKKNNKGRDKHAHANHTDLKNNQVCMCIGISHQRKTKPVPKINKNKFLITCDRLTHTRTGRENTAIYLNAQMIGIIVKKTIGFFTIDIKKMNF